MRRVRSLTAVIATAAAVVAVTAVAPAAHAAETSAAAAVSAATQATVARAGSAGTTTVAAGAPLRLDQGITIGSGDLKLRVNTGSGQRAQVFAGQTAYANTEKSTSTVVQDHAGATQILKVINDASAPTKYAFRFDLAEGMRLLAGTEGVVIESNNEVVGYIDAPWAVDATGASVPTSFEVHGDTLIQTVAHQGAAYPVVADPSVSVGRYWYVRYNRSEVARVNVRIVEAGNAAGITLMCGMLAAVSAVVGAACGAIAGATATSIAGQVRDAQRAGQCILHRYTLIAPVIVAWERYNC